MPTYSYRCLECQKELEICHSIKIVLADCPDCGESLSRLMDKSIFNVRNDTLSKKRTGQIERHIELTKNEIEKESRELKSRFFEEKK